MDPPATILGFDLSTGEPLGAPPADRPYWFHFNRTRDDVKAWARERSNMPEIAARAMLAEETRPRAEPIEGGLLVNLRAANLNPDAEEETISLRLWLEPTRLATFEKFTIFATRDVAEKLEAERGPLRPERVFTRLVARLMERLEPMIDDLDERLYRLEDDAIDPDTISDRRAIARIQRRVVYLRRYLAPQREAMLRLARGEVYDRFDEDELLRLREAANHLARLVEDLDAMHERAKSAQAEAAAQISERSGRKLYVFTVATIIFLPLSFLTGVFGMNVGGLPWTDTTSGFLIVSLIMAALVAGAIAVLFCTKWL